MKKVDKRKNRVFKTERRDIDFPMWRKKVDASIFYDKATLIPVFAKELWNIEKYFSKANSKEHPDSKVIIKFDGQDYKAHVTVQNSAKRKNSYRLFFSKDLADILKSTFIMTFMRDLEFKLGDYDEDENNRQSIEDIIPFNEFLDIEFDANTKTFIFNAHYRQKPIFNNLFTKILDTTVLSSISDEIEGKRKDRIQKSDWIKKEELDKTVDQPNVLYTLLDINNEQIYFGEAISLKKRLSGSRPEIPNWTHFRYDVLPSSLSEYRVDIERMIIRQLASLFENKKNLHLKNTVSSFKLMNKKIDK